MPNDKKRTAIPTDTSPRMFAQRDSAVDKQQTYQKAAQEAATLTQEAPGQYGAPDRGLMQQAREAGIGESRNQTVLAAQLQHNRDSLSLSALDQHRADARDWARMALQEKDALRRFGLDERQFDRGVVESNRDFGASRDDEDFDRSNTNRNFRRDVTESDRNFKAGREDEGYRRKERKEEFSTGNEQWEKEFKADKKDRNKEHKLRSDIQGSALSDKEHQRSRGVYLGALRNLGIPEEQLYDSKGLPTPQAEDYLDAMRLVTESPDYEDATMEEKTKMALKLSGITRPQAEREALPTTRPLDSYGHSGRRSAANPNQPLIGNPEPTPTAPQPEAEQRTAIPEVSKPISKKEKKQEKQAAIEWLEQNPDHPYADAIRKEMGIS